MEIALAEIALVETKLVETALLKTVSELQRGWAHMKIDFFIFCPFDSFLYLSKI